MHPAQISPTNGRATKAMGLMLTPPRSPAPRRRDGSPPPQQTHHHGRGHQRVVVGPGHEVHDDQRIQHSQPQRLGLADAMALRRGRDRDRQESPPPAQPRAGRRPPPTGCGPTNSATHVRSGGTAARRGRRFGPQRVGTVVEPPGLGRPPHVTGLRPSMSSFRPWVKYA